MSETNPIVAALQVAFESAVQAAVEQRLAPLAARLAALEARPAVGRLELGHLETIAHYVSLELLAGELDLSKLVEYLSMSELADALTPTQLQRMAEGVSLANLAPLAARLAALEARASDLTPHVQRLIFNDDELRQLAAHVNLAELAGELIPAQLRTIGEGVNLASLAAELSPSELVSNVDWSEVLDYADLASEVDLSDLADAFNVERIAEQIDIGNQVRDYLADTMFNIREA